MISSIFWWSFASLLGTTLLAVWVFRSLTESVSENTEKFVLSFGKISRRLDRPGLHYVPERLMPWVTVLSVSRQLDFRSFKNIQVNDHYGTTLVIDLFLEFQINDPQRALFSVENWEDALGSTVVHSTASILCAQRLEEILQSRRQLSDQLRQQINREMIRWGIELRGAMIQNIGVLPDVAKQLFRTVGARIERTRALLEEQGRLSVQQLEAETAVRVAELNALAEIQLPLETGKFYQELELTPSLPRRFAQLWELTCLDPSKTVAFQGFREPPWQQLEAAGQLADLSDIPGRA